MRFARLVLFIVLTVACGGGGSVSTGLPSRTDAIAFFSSHGFSGQESPLNDGTPRWLGIGPESAIGEVTGPASDVAKVSLAVAATGPGGTLTGEFLNRFAPGSNEFLQSVLTDTGTSGNQDKSQAIGNRNVRIQTTAVSGDYLVTVSVSD